MPTKLFIGSSTKGLNVAETIQGILIKKGVAAAVWDQVTDLNTSVLESLMRSTGKYDYACFVLRKDDAVVSRGKRKRVTRDNVLLEVGLFLGALGGDRVFLVYSKGAKPALPSDLAGITMLEYEQRPGLSLKSALAPVCLEMSNVIESGKAVSRRKGRRASRAHGFTVSPLDDENRRWENMTARMDRCRSGQTVRFISVTGKNYLLPNFQEGESVTSRLGPKALSRGVKLQGIVLDPNKNEATFRSSIESPNARRSRRLLIQDAKEVADLPRRYDETWGLKPKVRQNLELKYSPIGLSFGLWLFSDVAFVEPFHFGKRKNVQHLCGFAQLSVPKGTEEFFLLKKHFKVLWDGSEPVRWRKRR